MFEQMSDITAIILTYNEELHIRRCIVNLFKVANAVIVVDSYSTDKTVEIAKQLGATVYQNKYVNQAQQFQWALDHCPISTEWTLRIDADEYLSDQLVEEINNKVCELPQVINGVCLKRNVRFLGRTIQFGTLRTVTLLRLWRTGKAYVEQRWMDEQMILTEGRTVTFENRFYDENLNGLTVWTQKHNIYSNREVLVELDKQYGLFYEGASSDLKGRNRKKTTYYKLPRFFRAFLYFFVRYIFLLGFLDGIPGLVWLTLQAYWYRFLVDAKILEMEKRIGKRPSREEVIKYVHHYYEINVVDFAK